jgi:transcriptional regulator with XRE-family HTH domain
MRQFPLHFNKDISSGVRPKSFITDLGVDLAKTRRAAMLTQAAVADLAGVSLPTLRLAEKAGGSISTFVTVAAALAREVGGRSLPPGETLGGRLAVLRKRRALGRRPVSALAGISPSTLSAIESGRDGHLSTLIRVGGALGAQLRLEPLGTRPGFWTTAAASSNHHGWTTPPEILDLLYGVVGGQFDLDPCSPVRTGPDTPVKARVHYIATDDGLSLPWSGTVFMNPPYGKCLPLWMAKAKGEVACGSASAIFGLVPARTDTKWWHDNVAGVADVYMLKGRLAFGDGASSAPFPSAIVVWAAYPEHRARMAAAFPDAWHVGAAPMSAQAERLAAD